MKNKDLKSIIKMFFLIEKAGYNRCWNHSLVLTTAVKSTWEQMKTDCAFGDAQCARCGQKELDGCTQPGTQWIALPEGNPSPLCLQKPSASSFAFKWNVPRRYKLLSVTQPFTKTLFMKKLANSWQSYSHFSVWIKTAPMLQPPNCEQRNLQERETGDSDEGDDDERPRMDEALGRTGNLDSPFLPTSLAFFLPSQALPFTEPPSRLSDLTSHLQPQSLSCLAE